MSYPTRALNEGRDGCMKLFKRRCHHRYDRAAAALLVTNSHYTAEQIELHCLNKCGRTMAAELILRRYK